MSRDKQVVIAEIGAAHGIKGEVRLKSFTAVPADVAGFGPLQADDGRAFEIEAVRAAAGSSSPNMLVVRFKGVVDRNAAEKLTGTRLSVPQARLPAAGEGEFYHSDLIGLAAVTIGGENLGTVVAVQNYGAGDLLEVAPAKGATILVPFTEAAVPTVDVAGGRVIVDPPPGLIDSDGAS